MSARKVHTCRRCYTKEYIPTHQYVQFDLKTHYLCQQCWEDYRSWFFWGPRASVAQQSKATPQ